MSETLGSVEKVSSFDSWADFRSHVTDLINYKRDRILEVKGHKPKLIWSVGYDKNPLASDVHRYEFQETNNGFFLKVTNTRKPRVDEERIASTAKLSRLLGVTKYDDRYEYYTVEANNFSSEQNEEDYDMRLHFGERLLSGKVHEAKISASNGQPIPHYIETENLRVDVAQNLWNLIGRALDHN